MSSALQMYFSDPDDVKFEEFYDFFCTDISTKTKNQLYDLFLKIKSDRDELSFEDIARYYCEDDYETIISIMTSLASATEQLEDIYAKREIVHEDFVGLMIEKIMYYDIESRIENLKDPLTKLTQMLTNSINKIKKDSELGAKIDDILANFEICSEEPSSSKIDVTSNYERPMSVAKIDELQSKINHFQREIDNMRNSIDRSRQSDYFEDREPIYDAREKYGSEEKWGQEKPSSKSDFLTGHVWPKSRMLLAIVSKMSKEGLLNNQQKGILKDLIIQDDDRILQCLRQYELDGDRKGLYKNCLYLATKGKTNQAYY